MMAAWTVESAPVVLLPFVNATIAIRRVSTSNPYNVRRKMRACLCQLPGGRWSDGSVLGNQTSFPGFILR